MLRLGDDRKFIPTVLLSRGNRRESSPGSVFLETARIYGRLILGEEKVTSSSPGSLGRPNSVWSAVNPLPSLFLISVEVGDGIEIARRTSLIAAKSVFGFRND